MEKSFKCKLSNETRSLIFEEFTKAQKLLKKINKNGFEYIKRYSEVSLGGFGYKCKWWICSKVEPEILVEVGKTLPEGWSIEYVPGPYGQECVAIRTPKFSN